MSAGDADARILRYEVPVDDEWHEVRLGFDVRVLHVASRDPRVVEFWAVSTPGEVTEHRYFLVVGTGHPLPPRIEVCGSVVTAGGALVWHLLEQRAPTDGTR